MENYDLSTVSSGVDFLKDGYIDYAKEVITNRALADLYDGLKPVNRRILVTLHNDKVVKFTKSARVTGNTMSLHPHGDSAIYQAMVLMTETNGSLAFPLVSGSGNFGGVYKDDMAAAQRYTEVKLHENTEEYFREMNGVDMVPNFDSTKNEPVHLPVSFPAVLVNATSGIAVGFRSNVPSFNFSDVCDLVVEYIRDGECSTVIAPDFVTGGEYVKNQKELLKLMKTGVAKLKLRAKYTIEGKQILVSEVPYGKTIQKLVKQINDLNDSAIKNAYDTDDYEHGAGFKIDCSSKTRVMDALYTVLDKTDMQYNYHADLTVVHEGTPKRLGVWAAIAEWVVWRRGVLRKEYTHRYEAVKESLRQANAFMLIVNNYEKRMELVRIIADSGREAGRNYIRDNFSREEIPEDLIDFCAGRSLPSYHDGGRLAEVYRDGVSRLTAIEQDLEDIDNIICKQMDALKARYGAKMQRKTVISNQDYEFKRSDSSDRIIDRSECYYELKDGFLRKLKYRSKDTVVDFVVEGHADDTLVMFDNRGRLLRIYCTDIMYSGSDLGVYIPSYCGIKETDDYRITWMGRVDGRELMLLYKDGNVGYVNTAEWDGYGRNVKVLNRGISQASAPYLGAVLTDIPQMLYLVDEVGNIGWVYTDELKHKDRTARTRAVTLKNGVMLDSYLGIGLQEGMLILNNYGEYHGRVRELSSLEEWRGGLDIFQMMF